MHLLITPVIRLAEYHGEPFLWFGELSIFFFFEVEYASQHEFACREMHVLLRIPYRMQNRKQKYGDHANNKKNAPEVY